MQTHTLGRWNVVAWLALLCAADKSDLHSDVDVVAAEKTPLSLKQCQKVVLKVQKAGKYTEESIVPLCNEEVKSGGCTFFAEALSLASSHADFKAESFCQNMDRAQFCSEIMDKLLESRAVSDMAFGACERAKPAKSIEYCRRIQDMLALSVKQEDLDTMRACYMMEAYTNETAKGASDAYAKNRILQSSSKELDNVGKGDGPGHPPKIVADAEPLDAAGKGNSTSADSKEIVVKPGELDTFGKGKSAPPAPPKSKDGIVAKPAPLDSAGKGESSPTRSSPGGIIVEPVPLDPIGEGKGNITKPQPETTPKPETTSKPENIIAEPVPLEDSGKGKVEVTTPAPKETTAAPKVIITEPVPAKQNTLPTSGPTVAPATPAGDIVPLPQTLPSIPMATVQQRSSTIQVKPVAVQQPVPAAIQQPAPAAVVDQPPTVYVISMPAVDSNASAATKATQRQGIVAQLLAATQAAANEKVPVALPKVSTKTEVEKVESNATVSAQPILKTVSEHKVDVVQEQTKKDKPTLVGKFLGLFVKPAVKTSVEKSKIALEPKTDVKKSDYKGFLSGFVF